MTEPFFTLKASRSSEEERREFNETVEKFQRDSARVIEEYAAAFMKRWGDVDPTHYTLEQRDIEPGVRMFRLVKNWKRGSYEVDDE